VDISLVTGALGQWHCQSSIAYHRAEASNALNT